MKSGANKSKNGGNKSASPHGSTKDKTRAPAAPDMSTTNFPALHDDASSSGDGPSTVSETKPRMGGWASVLKKAAEMTTVPSSSRPKTTVAPAKNPTSTKASPTKPSSPSPSNVTVKSNAVKTSPSTESDVAAMDTSAPRPRRGWENAETLRKAQEAARRVAREAEMKRKAEEAAENDAESFVSRESTDVVETEMVRTIVFRARSSSAPRTYRQRR